MRLVDFGYGVGAVVDANGSGSLHPEESSSSESLCGWEREVIRYSLPEFADDSDDDDELLDELLSSSGSSGSGGASVL